jgi:hypothetical protein
MLRIDTGPDAQFMAGERASGIALVAHVRGSIVAGCPIERIESRHVLI